MSQVRSQLFLAPTLSQTLLDMARLIVMSLAFGQARGQRAGNVHADNPIPVSLHSCGADGCHGEAAWTTIDHAWRWLHAADSEEKCWLESGPGWNPTYCPNAKSCAQNCVVEGVGADWYQQGYGVSSAYGGLTMAFQTGTNTGSRMYLMDTGETYKLFKLKNREIAIDIDVSTLGCGVNAAVYLVGMNQRGSGSAGARYGTGYCDAQCPRERFINGHMNLDSSQGSCCAEIDLFEGNKYAQQMNLHPCDALRSTCTGATCDSFCDKDGCPLNGYRLGAPHFWGPGSEILDSEKPFTVVTQFITDSGTDSGNLVEIRRFFLQEGRRYGMMSDTLGMSTSAEFCAAQPRAFDQFTAKNGMKNLGNALDEGMVLTLSIWEDQKTQMRWLDSPPCPSTLTNEDIGAASAGAAVTYASIHYGALGSTQNEILMKAQISDEPVVSVVERQIGAAPLGAAVAVLVSLAAIAGLRWSSRRRSCPVEEEEDPIIMATGELQ